MRLTVSVDPHPPSAHIPPSTHHRARPIAAASLPSPRPLSVLRILPVSERLTTALAPRPTPPPPRRRREPGWDNREYK